MQPSIEAMSLEHWQTAPLPVLLSIMRTKLDNTIDYIIIIIIIIMFLKVYEWYPVP